MSAGSAPCTRPTSPRWIESTRYFSSTRCPVAPRRRRLTSPGTKAVDDLDTLLGNVDGVLLATPTNTHPEMLRAAIAQGVPTLCEKPIASDVAEMAALIDGRREVRRRGAGRLPAPVRPGRSTSSTAASARARSATSTWSARSATTRNPPDFSYLPASGGIFRDLLIHDLDCVPWLVGEPVVEVYASGSVLVHQAFADADDVDNAVVMLKFAGGAHATLAGGRHDPLGYDHRIEVLGSKDSLVVGVDARTPLNSLEPGGHVAGPDAYPGFPERFHRAYVNEMYVFTQVIAGEVANPSPARESLISLRLAEACEQSRRSGAPVRIEGN